MARVSPASAGVFYLEVMQHTKEQLKKYRAMADAAGVKWSTVYHRIKRGWTPEEAVSMKTMNKSQAASYAAKKSPWHIYNPKKR